MNKEMDVFRDFQTFLSESGTVPENKTKFYIHWVQRFLKFCNYELDNINTERVSQYLDSLDADEKIADWQVNQADNAIGLYLGHNSGDSIPLQRNLTNMAQYIVV